MSAMWPDSNALEMTTAEHYCTLRSLVSCLYASACCTVLENLIIIKLRRHKSTRAGAGITQNQRDWESFKLNHKHGHSPQVQVGLQQHLSL